MHRFSVLALLPLALLACSSPSNPAQDAGTDAGTDAPTCTTPPCATSKIRHVIVLVQENQSFETHYGAYCKAAAGSNPTCTTGPDCCEAAPSTEPSGASPTVLDDTTMGAHDPDHGRDCMGAEINGGKMDGYVAHPQCGHPGNFALADAQTIKPYWDLAAEGALADRYFHSVIGASSSNDMYFARAAFVFPDNAFTPKGAIGTTCQGGGPRAEYTDKHIGDLLDEAGVSWTVFAEGYGTMASAVKQSSCPAAPVDCPAAVDGYPCTYDASDFPFTYYPSSRDVPTHAKDLADFHAALAAGNLPAFSLVKGLGYKTEHPGYGTKLSVGVAFMADIVARVKASPAAADTLVLVTFDESGGYFDHVPPPPASTVDNQPYGARVPTLALGPFAKKNHVSHAVLEHSSIVKFLEWNFLEGKTGQLGTRDGTVANLGSLLDPAATGVPVPEN